MALFKQKYPRLNQRQRRKIGAGGLLFAGVGQFISMIIRIIDHPYSALSPLFYLPLVIIFWLVGGIILYKALPKYPTYAFAIMILYVLSVIGLSISYIVSTRNGAQNHLASVLLYAMTSGGSFALFFVLLKPDTREQLEN